LRCRQWALPPASLCLRRAPGVSSHAGEREDELHRAMLRLRWVIMGVDLLASYRPQEV
jgi:hypothetical protein